MAHMANGYPPPPPPSPPHRPFPGDLSSDYGSINDGFSHMDINQRPEFHRSNSFHNQARADVHPLDRILPIKSNGKVATLFEKHRFTRGESESGEKTWTRPCREKLNEVSQAELAKQVERKGSKVWKEYEHDDMKGNKREQVDLLIQNRNAMEQDRRFQWTLAALTLDQRNVSKGRVTVTMDVILKRIPKPLEKRRVNNRPADFVELDRRGSVYFHSQGNDHGSERIYNSQNGEPIIEITPGFNRESGSHRQLPIHHGGMPNHMAGPHTHPPVEIIQEMPPQLGMPPTPKMSYGQPPMMDQPFMHMGENHHGIPRQPPFVPMGGHDQGMQPQHNGSYPKNPTGGFPPNFTRDRSDGHDLTYEMKPSKRDKNTKDKSKEGKNKEAKGKNGKLKHKSSHEKFDLYEGVSDTDTSEEPIIFDNFDNDTVQYSPSSSISGEHRHNNGKYREQGTYYRERKSSGKEHGHRAHERRPTRASSPRLRRPSDDGEYVVIPSSNSRRTRLSHDEQRSNHRRQDRHGHEYNDHPPSRRRDDRDYHNYDDFRDKGRLSPGLTTRATFRTPLIHSERVLQDEREKGRLEARRELELEHQRERKDELERENAALRVGIEKERIAHELAKLQGRRMGGLERGLGGLDRGFDSLNRYRERPVRGDFEDYGRLY